MHMYLHRSPSACQCLQRTNPDVQRPLRGAPAGHAASTRGARDEHAQLVPAEAGGLYGVEHHNRALGPIEQAAEEERRPVRCNGARADQDAVRCNRAQQIRTRCSGFEPLASMPADGVGLAQVGPSRDELLCEAGLATRTADMQRGLQIRPALDIE